MEPSELYQLLDTIVKIGLGAIIAGFFGIWGIKSNQKREIRLLRAERHLSIIERAVQAVEESSSPAKKMRSLRIAAAKAKDSQVTHDAIVELIRMEHEKGDYGVAASKFDLAIAEMQMLGLEDVAKAMGQYADELNKLYLPLESLSNDSVETLAMLWDAVKFARMRVLRSLGEAYDGSA